jgi:hypothetical protein
MHLTIFRPLALLLFGIVLLALTACKQAVDLDAVQTLATSVQSSEAGFAAIANDFAQSCYRDYSWRAATALDPSQLASMSTTCAANTAAAQQWQNANSVVVSYILALGNLAGRSDNAGDFGISDLATNLAELQISAGSKFFSDAQVTSLTQLSSQIVSDIFAVRRRSEIAELAPKADLALQAYLSVLQTAAQKNYAKQLGLERDTVQKAFRISGAAAIRTPGEQAAYVQTRTDFQAQLADLGAKEAAIGSYVAVLSDIGKAHGKLVASIASNDPSQITAIVRAYFNAYQSDIVALRSAFK